MARILIAGLGSVGRRHLRNLSSLGDHEFILLRTGHSTLPEQELQGWVSCPDLDSALSHHPEIAVIANPTSLHVETARACAEARCHLFIEKPLGDRLEGCEELVSLVERKRLITLVGFQFRFHPGLEQVRRLLCDGAIGPVVSAQAHWGEYLPGWHPWEDYRQGYSARADLGGGVLLTLCHPQDYMRWLLGPVSEVSALLGSSGGLELAVEDTAEINLRFSSGASGQIHVDYVQRPPSHWLRVTGQNGSLEWDNRDGAVRYWSADRGEWENFPAPPGFERNHLFVAEMRHLLACIARHEPTIAPLSDGFSSLRLALAAKQAAAEKRTVTL